ncbi:MAG TPA: imidazole glycerol phosphate synthase subunit HisH [Gemmatimonadaceae bacterium]|jgi:glutamine amidotransferase|nr:imidazole glycerol phosphate synthase subunit HisH [Gemmatimonadaceae bacterium]
MRVTIFDYGAGNLHSLGKALETANVSVRVETDPVLAIETDVLVLPGVGAFGAAAARLAPGRGAMRDAIAGGLPTIGICLGMQLFFDASDEGEGEGLGLIPGRVSRLAAERVPQIGWNTIVDARDPLLDVAPLPIAYYANSFVCRPTDASPVVAWSEHEGDRFPAVVRAGSALGVQFHPEKSSAAGVRFLHAFLDDALTTKRAR